MSTYRTKIAKYENIVRKALELGLEPDKTALQKLYYYVGRAQEKGIDHKKVLKDRLNLLGISVSEFAKETLPTTAEALVRAAAALLAGK